MAGSGGNCSVNESTLTLLRKEKRWAGYHYRQDQKAYEQIHSGPSAFETSTID